VAAVFAKVRGDAVRASSLTEGNRGDGIGVSFTTCLSQRGDVVDVDAQSKALHGAGLQVTLLR
jgi:hypothetical protein